MKQKDLAKVHPAIPQLVEDLRKEKMDRREFVRTTTLLGLSASMAYAVAGPTPLRCWRTEEKAKGAVADRTLLQLVSACVLADLRPRESWRAPKAFREQIIKALAERVLEKTRNQGGVCL